MSRVRTGRWADEWFPRALASLVDLPWRTRVAICATSAVATLAIDWLTGADTPMMLGYSFTVALTAWTLTRRWAIAGAVVLNVVSTLVVVTSTVATPDRVVWIDSALRTLSLLFTAALVSALRTHLDRAAYVAAHDALTGTRSRRGILDELADAATRARRDGTALTVVYLDLDDLKRVNDQHGHAAGDRMIVDFAWCLRGGMRPTDVVGRLGGDEFLVICPGTTAGDAVTIITHVLSRSGVPTASWGIASTADSYDPDELLAAADRSMYHAKRAPRLDRAG